MQIDLQKVSKLLSEKLGQPLEITEIEPQGSGYHSDGFKLTASNGGHYFLKRVKSHDLGFEFSERKIASLLVSDGMGKRAKLGPQPVGLALLANGQEIVMPDIDDEVEIYHLQEFRHGEKSYLEILQAKKSAGKMRIDEEDINELEKVVALISQVHAIKHSSADEERLKKIYNDGLRSILNNPELTLVLLQSFPADHPLLPRHQHQEYLGLMLALIYKWENRADRLCALHGDFWGANLFFTGGQAHLIDYSRIPWGDPGIDVGWWFCQYLWAYFETGNQYFHDLGEKFLSLYEAKTGDREIRDAMALSLGLLGIINTTPLFYSGYDMAKAARFLDQIRKILSEQEFSW